MVQPSQSVLRSDRSHRLGDSRIQSLDGASFQSSQLQLDLGPAFFDGVEVGRIRRQIQQAGTCSFDLLPHGGRLVGLQVRSEEHTSELQSLTNLVCRLLLEKKKQ